MEISRWMDWMGHTEANQANMANKANYANMANEANPEKLSWPWESQSLLICPAAGGVGVTCPQVRRSI